MAVDVDSVIDIACARSTVAAFVADPDNARTWYENIREVSWRTGPPVAVGTQVDFVAHFLGRTLAYTYEVVELQPNERFVMRTAQGPFPMETTYSWSDTADGGTRMSLRNRGEPSGFGHVAAPLMAFAMRRANRKDLELLKATLEGSRGGGESRAWS
ncbi:MAG: SRPBCC family protein [Actinomycetota bacterium]|nr:SRPBCC family protein [Actinomycetota bacterium]